MQLLGEPAEAQLDRQSVSVYAYSVHQRLFTDHYGERLWLDGWSLGESVQVHQNDSANDQLRNLL